MSEDTRTIQVNSISTKFPDNKVKTTKYTPLTFAPFFFLDQFSKPANFYFLIISSLQQIPNISPTGRWGTLIPLVLSLIVSGGKEIFEDLQRANDDQSINKRKVLIVDKGKDGDTSDAINSINLESLRVGQVVRILQNEMIPADLVILKSSEGVEGHCYLETAAIDGESNYKLRRALTQTCPWNGSVIECDHPNNEIYRFQGTLKLNNQTPLLSLDKNQFLPRGSFLVNTEWIVGVVVYTGIETKIMQNVKDFSTRKFTKMDRLNDIQNAQIVGILFILVVILFLGNIYYDQVILPAHYYLNISKEANESVFKIFRDHFANLLTFIILLNNLVPISLSVTLEIVRAFLAKLINNDLDMYDEELQIPSKAQSSNVLDELGRIEYIMTDKTGTLTCNQMTLKSLMIDGQIYRDLQSNLFAKATFPQKVQTFLECVSLCHSVIREKNGHLQASSPDELALLHGAQKLGVAFPSIQHNHIKLKFSSGEVDFSIKFVIEFTSDRKRMSVIAFNEQDQKYFVIAKGADSVIFPICANITETDEKCVHDFSCEGLRTLCFAYKEITAEDFDNLNSLWTTALNTHGPLRQDLLDSVIASIESNLNFMGISGIEDQLQVGVPEAITSLLMANIKIWILTGDKAETAVNTALLSKILKQNHTLLKLHDKMSVIQFTGSTVSDEPFSLLVSGEAFNFILNDADEPVKRAFVSLAQRARTLISYRLSPLEKTEITNFVKNDLNKTTLAIGDGGNDVGMIQAAHVGVGINGLEGTQAARSADFSIAKFRFLVKLLLVHGAWSFHRISRVILYMMYKNFILVLCQFWYSLFNSFSAKSAFNPTILMLFNSLFSAVPPVIIGISDQYVTAPQLINHPQIYQFGQKGKFYDRIAFWECILNATVQSFTAVACFYLLIQGDPVFTSGNPINLPFSGDLLYFIILTIISVKVVLFTNYFTNLMLISLITALILCILCLGLLSPSNLPFYPSLLVLSSIVLVTVTTLLRDFVWKFYKRQFKPRPYHIIQEMRAVQIRRDKREATAANKKTKLKLSKSASIDDNETVPLRKYTNRKQ